MIISGAENPNRYTLDEYLLYYKRIHLNQSLMISSISSTIIAILLFVSELIYGDFHYLTFGIYIGIIFLNILRLKLSKTKSLSNFNWVRYLCALQVSVISLFCIAFCINFYIRTNADLRVILYIFINSIASAISIWLYLDLKTLLICCFGLVLTAFYGFYLSNTNLLQVSYSLFAVSIYFFYLIQQSKFKYQLWLSGHTAEFELKQALLDLPKKIYVDVDTQIKLAPDLFNGKIQDIIIDELRRAQFENIKSTEELFNRKKYSDLGKLVNEVMHDINNPLCNIQIQSQYLEKNAVDLQLSEKLVSAIGSIRTSSRRISRMIDAINEILSKKNSSEDKDISVSQFCVNLTEKIDKICSACQIETSYEIVDTFKNLRVSYKAAYSSELILSIVSFSADLLKNSISGLIKLKIEKLDTYIILFVGDSENKSLKAFHDSNWYNYKFKRSEVIHKFIENNLKEYNGYFFYDSLDDEFQYRIKIPVY